MRRNMYCTCIRAGGRGARTYVFYVFAMVMKGECYL